MRVLVTRPEDDAEGLVKELKKRGIESFCEPMISITVDPDGKLDLEGAQAILATSANGVRALARMGPPPKLPLYAVGDATARTARDVGFVDVESAAGDVEALSKLVCERLTPGDGILVHPTGGQTAGNLGSVLEEAGFTYRRAHLYEADSARSLSPGLVADMRNGAIDGVALYSPRTAKIFADLVRKSRLVRACRHLDAYCLSPAVAEAAGVVAWREIYTAAAPNQESFMALLPDSGSTDHSTTDSEIETADVADSPEASPVAPPPRDRRSTNGFVLFLANLIGFAVIAAGAAATAPLWSPYVAKLYPGANNPDPEQVRIAQLSDRLVKLETESRPNVTPELKALDDERKRLQTQLDATLNRLNSLEESMVVVRQMSTAVTSSSSPDNAASVLKRLTDRLEKLESGSGDSGAESRKILTDLTGQVAKLEAAIGPGGSAAGLQKGQALLVAVGQLRDAARSARKFRSELTAVQALTEGDLEITAQVNLLEPSADSGVLNFEMLRVRFDAIAGQIVRADIIPDSGGWIDRTIDRLTASVQWRRTDNLEGPGVEAVVARAEKKLGAADIAGAIAELKSLPPKSLAVAGPWMERARALMASERALAALQIHAVSRLSTPVR